MRKFDANCSGVVENFGFSSSFVKPALHLYSIPSICPNTGFFHLFKSKNQARPSSEAPKCADSRRERSSLSLYSCSSTPYFPIQRISVKGSLVARFLSSQII
ncbi:hypothetical protein AVEN_35358-1 [Araneus ventricosus]|uniref:Uncharacterized protein n=1 Tax=Araneus ventricosus TaxID=182803 RepID=A0A4Y2L9W4_ARAVE|nr:hypothetical protein AVEN_35358-1 [Araneus ventricosus]